MGKIITNPDGTHTMKGFSTKNPEDMKALKDKFVKLKKPEDIPVKVEPKVEEKVEEPKKKKVKKKISKKKK